jgi:hypothetical protein
MRIQEILFWNNDPAAEENLSDHGLDFPPDPFNSDLTKLAGAFTKDGMVKHFWNLSGSERQPSGPAPPDPEPELIPSGTLEPTTVLADRAGRNHAPVGQHRLIPFRQ